MSGETEGNYPQGEFADADNGEQLVYEGTMNENSAGSNGNDWGRWLRRNSSIISHHHQEQEGGKGEVQNVQSCKTYFSPRTPRSVAEFELEEGLIMLIGPEKLTMKVSGSLELIVPKEVRVEMKSSLSPEEAGLLKQAEEFLYILYVMDASCSTSLEDVDEQLTFLQRNYSLSFDCMDFILAKKCCKGELCVDGKQVKAFMEKYKRPVITVTLNKEHHQEVSGDEKNLTDQMAFFLRRFELFVYNSCNHQ